MSEKTLEELKNELDIVTVAENYGEVIKSGTNYKFKNDSSIVINSAKQIFSDFGKGNIKGGSVLDLIMLMENKDKPEAIKKLKSLNGINTYHIDPALQIQRKEEEKASKNIDLNSLSNFANNILENGKILNPFIKVYLPKTDPDDINIYYDDLMFKTGYDKLFETSRLPKSYETKLNYIFNFLVGYDKFYDCPSIIIRDSNYNIVDYIAYRPNKPASFTNWNNPKYIYKNSHNRGSFFIFPFRKEIEKILFKDDHKSYVIVGEGIKNGLNALVYSVPFISIESTSNSIDTKLIDYIKDLTKKDYNLISMFDGDIAGAKAYLIFIKTYYEDTSESINDFLKSKENIVLADKSNEKIVLSNFISFIKTNKFKTKNFLDFDSNLDFTDYIQSENK